MNELTTKIFEKHPVRIVVENEETLFVGKDVCNVLGFKNPSDAMKRHCKGVVKRYPLSSEGGKQNVRAIILSDVMRLICNSQLPDAQRFEKWVFEEVLPTIIRTGSYSIQQQTPILTTNAIYQDVTTRMKEEIKKAMDDLEKLEDLPNRKKLIELIPRLTDYQCGELIRVSWRRWGKPDHSELPE